MHDEMNLDDVLFAIEGTSNPEEAWAAMEGIRRDALRVPELGADLADLIAAPLETDEDAIDQQRCAVALAAILMEARMDRDNGGALGPAFLSAVEAELSEALEFDGDDSDATGLMILARCYHQAGISTPSLLTEAVGRIAGERMPGAADGIPDIDAMLDSLRDEAEGDAFTLHTGLSEMLAAFDPAIWAPVVMAVIERDEPLFDRLGFYWLLDPQMKVRQAAVAGFAARMEAGRLDADVATTFVTLRPWLPDDDARKALDVLIRAAMRREITEWVVSTAWKHHRIITSLPDGVGAQSVAVAAQSGGMRSVVMLLLKQDFGITDAYVIPCNSASEQRRLLDEIGGHVEMHDVPFDYIEMAIKAAVADGLRAGHPPAPGMLDVIDVLGIHDLRPNDMTAVDWVAAVDPDGTIAAMSPQKRGRLINAAEEWHADSPMAESWFEDNADIQQALSGAMTSASREKAVWRYLETRRDRWALLIARTAGVLASSKTGSQDDAFALAATAWAMEDGRPLPKTPLMRAVHDFTLVVMDDPFDDMRMAFQELSEPPPFEIETSLADPETIVMPKPEKRDELKKILKASGSGITANWIDGYLAAISVAPKMINPNDWIGALLSAGGDFENQDQLQRYLDLVVLRYNSFNALLGDEDEVKTAVTKRSIMRVQEWCAGFGDAVGDHPVPWKSKAVKADDKKILHLIDNVAGGAEEPRSLNPVIPAWLVARRKAQR